jgi:hypothetical protein
MKDGQPPLAELLGLVRTTLLAGAGSLIYLKLARRPHRAR